MHSAAACHQLQTHPCFYAAARGRYGRIHLPVASSCNIQCAYCRRDHDCLHENRPGASAGVLTPQAAAERFTAALRRTPHLTVAGIAGPGDPFCQPELTLETFGRIRRSHPRIALCVSTNGLDIGPYIDQLRTLEVAFVTLTVNTSDPRIGSRLVDYVRSTDGQRLTGIEAAGVLLEKQLAAITTLKRRGFTVKINSVVVPGINDAHLPLLARQMGRMKVDLMNLLPLIPLPGTAMAAFAPPSRAQLRQIRALAGIYLPQMTHCMRCRSDAVGRLNETGPVDLALLE